MASDDVLSIVEGEEVGGVVFSTVAARRPELKRELGILRQALLVEEQAGGGDDGSAELKVRTNGSTPPFFAQGASSLCGVRVRCRFVAGDSCAWAVFLPAF